MSSTAIGHPDERPGFPADCTAAAAEPRNWESCAAPRRQGPGLLVSVRSVAEAATAARCGADVVDLKEPQRGALGAASVDLWRQIDEALPAGVCLSAALGEAIDSRAVPVEQLPARFRFAKAGPAGAGDVDRLIAHWRTLAIRLGAADADADGRSPEMSGASESPGASGAPLDGDGELASPRRQLVAVAYADHQAAACPAPEAVLVAAAAAGLRWWLLDTCVKDGRSVVDHLGRERLRSLDRLACQQGIAWVLAGSLRRDHLTAIAGLRPTLIGVRGDVCRGGRGGVLLGSAIVDWQRRLAALGGPAAGGGSN